MLHFKSCLFIQNLVEFVIYSKVVIYSKTLPRVTGTALAPSCATHNTKWASFLCLGKLSDS